jgi:hypothetical protein
MAESWRLEGQYLEACTCKGACPCLFLGAPTEGDCTALVAWHIDRGHYGELRLDDLNVAVALHSPGPMYEGKWKVVLYLDKGADALQTHALGEIFGGKAGGHPAVLASFIGEVLGVEQVPMRYEGGKRQVRVAIGDGAEAVLQAMEGQDGSEVTVHNHPFAVAPGFPLTAARSSSLRHDAHGLKLQLSERGGYYSPFAYAGA